MTYRASLDASIIIVLGVIGLALIALGIALVLLGNHLIKRSRARAATAQRHPTGTRVTAAIAPPRRRAQAGPRGYGFGTRVHR
jgi:hypothetical protein